MSLISKKNKDFEWWLNAMLWIGSGLSIALYNNQLAIFLYFISGLHFIIASQTSYAYFPITLLKGLLSFFMGIFSSFYSNLFNQTLPNPSATQTKTPIWKKIILYTIPVLIVIIFLKLYQLANPVFAEYTAFLNLDFIKWDFIVLYIVLYSLLYGFFYYQKIAEIDELDKNLSSDIQKNYTDKIQSMFGIENELKMSKLIIFTLTILLIFFLVIDGLTIFNVIENNLNHSQNVHQGIFILILSIVLVIFIVTYVFRGQLNFIETKTLKNLAILWLILNIILTFFTSIKNYNYINEWGLTHKRIGVFVYLFLCLIGLLLTIYKIQKQKSLWFLFNKSMMSFLTVLICYSLFNWNGFIAKYNLSTSHLTSDKVDLAYNFSLGYEAYPYLMDYFNKHPLENHFIRKKFDYEVKHLNPIYQNWTDFPSLKLSYYLVYKQLENYKPLLKNDYEPYYSRF
jgi:hypothetical protein